MDRQDAPRATLLIMAIFVLQPFAIGGWLALIPVIKESIGLSKGELALALIGMPIALIPSLQVAGRILSRFGPRRVLWTFFPLQAAASVLPILSTSGPMNTPMGSRTRRSLISRTSRTPPFQCKRVPSCSTAIVCAQR